VVRLAFSGERDSQVGFGLAPLNTARNVSFD
jgi:hypothetical protein